MLDLELNGRYFKTHQPHGSIHEQDTLSSAYSAKSTPEARKMSWLDWKIVYWDVKHRQRQTDKLSGYFESVLQLQQNIYSAISKMSQIFMKMHIFWFYDT